MLIDVMMALLSCLAWSPSAGAATTGAVEIVGKIECGGDSVVSAVVVGSGPMLLLAGGGGTGGTAPAQVLTTTVQDPNHPVEPWVVTTYRQPDESYEAFIKRHREMVEAVRKALGG